MPPQKKKPKTQPLQKKTPQNSFSPIFLISANSTTVHQTFRPKTGAIFASFLFHICPKHGLLSLSAPVHPQGALLGCAACSRLFLRPADPYSSFSVQEPGAFFKEHKAVVP
jgi:hypothetical protein